MRLSDGSRECVGGFSLGACNEFGGSFGIAVRGKGCRDFLFTKTDLSNSSDKVLKCIAIVDESKSGNRERIWLV